MADDSAIVQPSENGEPDAPSGGDAEPATPDALALATLKADLNRSGNFPSDDSYLLTLIAAARHWLTLQGVRDDASPTYLLILAARAAWIYRKRVTGEAEPQFLRRMVHDFKLSQGATV